MNLRMRMLKTKPNQKRGKTQDHPLMMATKTNMTTSMPGKR